MPETFLARFPVSVKFYFHVNVTCFAAKHVKFDGHYSN